MIGTGKAKYFIAVVPPSPIYEEALTWKNFFKLKFNSKAALRSPPHITLHMPFQWNDKKEQALIEALTRFAHSQAEFNIELRDFGCFPPRVIYINVLETANLQALQKQLEQFCKRELNLSNANRKDQAYHPHLTVAFRDLKKPVFPEAWNQVKELEFRQSFTCNAFALLKHDGRAWAVKESFNFSV